MCDGFPDSQGYAQETKKNAKFINDCIDLQHITLMDHGHFN